MTENPTQTLWDLEIAAVDVETTGLKPYRGDRVLEVAVARGRYGEVPKVWSSLVNPEREVDAVAIHGITQEMVEGQPVFPVVAPAFQSWIEGAIVLGHNIAFDLDFLKNEQRLGAPLTLPREESVMDTLLLARRSFSLPSRRLTDLCTYFQVENLQAHRAASDARATFHLWWAMLDRIDPAHQLTLAGLRASFLEEPSSQRREIREALEEARVNGRPIEIEYASGVGAGFTRRVIEVKEINSRWVEAWCQLRQEDRTFRLDRIRIVRA